MSNRRPNQRRQASATTGFASGRSVSDHSVRSGIVRSPLIEQLIEPLLQQGHEEKALAQLLLLQQSRCTDPRVGVLMGILLSNRGDTNGAIRCYQQALQNDPNCVDALINLGNLAAIQGQHDDANQYYERADAINPSYPTLLANLSNLLLETGQYHRSHPVLKRWIALEPNNVEPLIRLGFCLTEIEDWAGARSALQTAVMMSPGHPHALARLATLEMMAGNNLDLALDLARRAHNTDANSSQLNLILGNVQLAATLYGEAEQSFQRVVNGARLPFQALYNLAFTYFGLSKRELGYQHLEFRNQIANPLKPHAHSRFNPFNPTDSCRKLILLSEQGFGDTLQFVRYAPWLLRQEIYEQIILYVQSQLVVLLRSSLTNRQGLTIESSDQAPASLEDKNVLPLLSCPLHFGEHASDTNLHGSYLSAPKELINNWSERIRRPHPNQWIIAICWQGNPQAERTHNRGRSMPLAQILRLAEIDGIKLLSLQKGPGSEQLTPEIRHRHFVDCQVEITAAMPFEDSAAILSCCDLMITTDTGMAHLCGALGKPLWLLLSHRPDWRWGPHGECTFWYPQMKTFQQSIPGDWHGVIDNVQARLKDHDAWSKL